MNMTATFQTEGASRYLKMLCTHFSRKVEADFDTKTGWVNFPMGRCEMTASAQQLEMQVTAEDQTRLDQLVQIVTSHLERFAFRENPELVWRPRQTDLTLANKRTKI